MKNDHPGKIHPLKSWVPAEIWRLGFAPREKSCVLDSSRVYIVWRPYFKVFKWVDLFQTYCQQGNTWLTQYRSLTLLFGRFLKGNVITEPNCAEAWDLTKVLTLRSSQNDAVFFVIRCPTGRSSEIRESFLKASRCFFFWIVLIRLCLSFRHRRGIVSWKFIFVTRSNVQWVESQNSRHYFFRQLWYTIMESIDTPCITVRHVHVFQIFSINVAEFNRVTALHQTLVYRWVSSGVHSRDICFSWY